MLFLNFNIVFPKFMWNFSESGMEPYGSSNKTEFGLMSYKI